MASATKGASPVGGIVAQGTVDLERERRRSSLLAHAQQLTNLLYGGPEKYAAISRVKAIIEGDEAMRVDDYYFATREEKFSRALEKTVRMVNLVQKHGWTEEEGIQARLCIREQLPLGLHWVMFIPAIKSLGTPEQQAKWLPLARTLQIVGTYAQTELGHGTYLRGLETTATYSRETQEFVLHSPTTTATKWWPGTLGICATHCVVMATLVIDGNSYGAQAFIVQIRDLDSHLPLPGIQVGDIGPKMGYDSMDNGFLRFDHVHIPRQNMLMRHAKVSVDGAFHKPPHSKLSYATMLFVRSHMVLDSSRALQTATTIAVRYAAVRRQSKIDDADHAETQVLDYTLQQTKLLALVATAYAFHFLGVRIRNLYEQLQSTIGQGNLELLPFAHATTAGLKAFCSDIASAGIETCRKCCGGHGYSKLSGLPDTYFDYVPACTYEGENVVMSLQAARYLIKAFKQASGHSARELAYLHKPHLRRSAVQSAYGWRDTKHIIMALEKVAFECVSQAAQTLDKYEAQGMSASRAWNEAAAELVKAANAHCALFTSYTFFDVVTKNASAKFAASLGDMARLFALDQLQQQGELMLGTGYTTTEQQRLLHEQLAYLRKRLREDAVVLVDAFDLSDHYLNSALGRKDGNVYEALFNAVQGRGLNRQKVHPAVTEHLHPLMRLTRRMFAAQAKL